MRGKLISTFVPLSAAALVLALLSLTGCAPLVLPLPTVRPSASPAPTICAHGEILHPELGAPGQALTYVTVHHPQQAPPPEGEWTYMGQDSAGDDLMAVDRWTLRMSRDLTIVIANEATGFEWKGRVGVRTPPGGCGNDEYVVQELSVTVPTPGAATAAPRCTPELVTRLCKESEFCYDDRGPAKEAVWDYFETHYPDQGPKYGIELWPRNLVGQVTTDSGTFDVYADSEGEWTLSIARSEPPIRFILAGDAGAFRWEGLATPRQECEGCYCREVFEASEVSVEQPAGAGKPPCGMPGFLSVMQAAVAHVGVLHPEQPTPNSTRGSGGGWLVTLDWSVKPTRVAVENRDTKLRWEGEMTWHADDACRLQVDRFTELPPATATPSPTASPAPTATPSGPPDFSALHLGWIWPDGKMKVRDPFAVDGAGIVYINDWNARMHAIQPQGKELWAFEEGEDGMTPPVLSPDGQTLYVVSLIPDTLYALGLDGQQRWEADVRHEPIALPVVAPDGAIYVRTMGGVYRYPPDGSEPAEFLWSHYIGFELIAFDARGRLYVIPFNTAEVRVYSPEGKQEQVCSIEELSGDLGGWPAGGFVYSTSEGDLAVAGPDCRQIWRYAGGQAEPTSSWWRIAVASDGSVFAARKNGEIVALDATGKLRWKQAPDEQFGEPLHLLPAPGGALYAVSKTGRIAAFDPAGQRVWTHLLPAGGEPGPPQLTPGGGLALVQGARLWYFTTDPALVAAEPTPVPPPKDMDAAQEEIVSYVLAEIGCDVESIVVWGQPGPIRIGSGSAGDPIRVWSCSDGALSERQDMKEAIAAAQKRNEEAGLTRDAYPVASYEFTIDVDESLQRAEVYFGWVRGPTWGQGDLMTLERSATGQWSVVKSEMQWIS